MLFFIFFPGYLIPLIVAVLCGAAAATAFFIVRNKRKKNGTLSKKNVLIQGLQANIDDFCEMFEPVYSVSVGKNEKQAETFECWNTAVLNSAEDNGYKALFAKKFGDYAAWGQGKKKLKVKKANKIYRKKAKKLVKLFFKANILRGADIYETGCETTAERFVLAGDGSIETDRKYEVLAPCWKYGEKVVDKGVIR